MGEERFRGGKTQSWRSNRQQVQSKWPSCTNPLEGGERAPRPIKRLRPATPASRRGRERPWVEHSPPPQAPWGPSWWKNQSWTLPGILSGRCWTSGGQSRAWTVHPPTETRTRGPERLSHQMLLQQKPGIPKGWEIFSVTLSANTLVALWSRSTLLAVVNAFVFIFHCQVWDSKKDQFHFILADRR